MVHYMLENCQQSRSPWLCWLAMGESWWVQGLWGTDFSDTMIISPTNLGVVPPMDGRPRGAWWHDPTWSISRNFCWSIQCGAHHGLLTWVIARVAITYGRYSCSCRYSRYKIRYNDSMWFPKDQTTMSQNLRNQVIINFVWLIVACQPLSSTMANHHYLYDLGN